MKKVFILLLLFIVACGGPNEETVVQDTTITSIEDTTTTTVEDTTTTTVEETTTTTIPMTPVIQFTDDTELKTPFVELGTLIGILEIDILGVETLIYEGTSLEYLQTGVGHYQATETPFWFKPYSNTAIAGHRTSYTAPFMDLDKLVAGDKIKFWNSTKDTYVEYAVTNVFVTHKDDVSIFADPDTEEMMLTLTTCHPKYSAAERLIVQAVFSSTNEQG
jgi:sortase A